MHCLEKAVFFADDISENEMNNNNNGGDFIIGKRGNPGPVAMPAALDPPPPLPRPATPPPQIQASFF